jgi:UDP-glucose 4-epimerase
MNVLITGGAGFVGSHLCDRLLARGDRVTVIDNFATARRENLAPHGNLKLIEGTIADANLVEQGFRTGSPEIVVHAAAAYKDPDNWHEDVATNILGSVNVVRAAQKSKVRRVIYFQTALCYGLKPLEQPITLNHRIHSYGSSYAISKTGGEQYLDLGGLDYISFRLANAYGPRNLSGPLPTFYHRLTNGKPCFVMDTRRDFIFIDDLVNCVMKAVDGAGQKGAYHISSGGDFAIKELFEETVKALAIKLDKEVEVRPRLVDDAFTILLDPSKTNQDFNWKTTTPLAVGVCKAVDYYRTFGISHTFTHLKQMDGKEKKVA